MKKIIIGLFFGAFAHAAEMPDFYALKNSTKGYISDGFNLKVTKKIGDKTLRRIVAFQDSCIIGSSEENIDSLTFNTYGKLASIGAQSYDLSKLLTTPARSVAGAEITVKFGKYSQSYSDFQIIDLLTIKNDPNLWEKFKTKKYIFLGSRLGLILGIKGNFFANLYKEEKEILFGCFPGLLQRGVGNINNPLAVEEKTTFDVARYVLGLPEQKYEITPITRDEIEDAYKWTAEKWKLLAKYFESMGELIAKDNCLAIIDFVNASYQKISELFGEKERKNERDLQNNLSIPESYSDEVLAKLNLSRSSNAYDVLELNDNATLDQINKQGRALLGKWSPDKNIDEPLSQDIYKLIGWARDLLREIKESQQQ